MHVQRSLSHVCIFRTKLVNIAHKSKPYSTNHRCVPQYEKSLTDFSVRLSKNRVLWEQRESNPRPSACKADALNQLSYAPETGLQIYD